jgi:hypothetical protein
MPSFRAEEERFWEKVEKTSSCWIWLGGTLGSRNLRYGNFYLRGGRKRTQAHRWSYEALVGTIPKGLVLDHLCRNTVCVNPEHLEPVTHRTNILRGEGLAAKQARQTHCKRGHSLEDAHILRNGARDCRICRKLRASRRTLEYRKVHG